MAVSGDRGGCGFRLLAFQLSDAAAEAFIFTQEPGNGTTMGKFLVGDFLGLASDFLQHCYFYGNSGVLVRHVLTPIDEP